MTNIIDFLNELINDSPDHCISYAKYMESALYHPEYGYYNKDRHKVGKEGDFITSISVNDIFAKVMADAFHQYIEKYDLAFNICEIGGAEGSFARQVLDHWQEKYPKSYNQIQYLFVEQSPSHRYEAERQLSAHHKSVRIYSTIDQLIGDMDSFDGVVFSNELFDALPVHVIEKRHGDLYEVMVTNDHEGKIVEKFMPLSNETVRSWITTYGLPFNEGQRNEVPLLMTDLIKKLTSWMRHSVFVTIDYGYTTEELTYPERRDGSLRGYYKHQLITNPLERPGEMDLTTHLPIDGFNQACLFQGLTQVEATYQGDFLHKSGILNYLENHSGTNPFSDVAKKNRAIRSFLLGEFSRAFYVWVFSK